MSDNETIALPLADVAALVKLAWEQTRYIEATDRSATGSIYGIEYADKTIARVAVKLPRIAETCSADAPRKGYSL
jgi:hypothetical protein